MTGPRVQVYWHPKTATFAVRDLESCCVVECAREIVLYDARFVVNDEKRREGLRCGYRNNHAWVEGVWTTGRPPLDDEEAVRVSYSPAENESFVTASGTPVQSADWVVCTVSGDKPEVKAYNLLFEEI